MKRLLPFLLLAAVSLVASAQVRVDSLNRLVLGNASLNPFPAIGTQSTPVIGGGSTPGEVIPGQPVFDIQLDSLSRMCVLGEGYNKSGGYITFGDNRNVSVGEKSLKSTDSNILELRGSKGIIYTTDGTTRIFKYFPGTKKFEFNSDITVNGVFVNSDSRLKSGVEELSGAGEALAAITPVSYTLTGQPASGTATLSADGEDAMQPQTPDSRERFGFVAQEVREVFPQLVSEDEDGYLSVDYIGFIPVLVDAVRELSAKVEEQEQTIASLTNAAQRKAAAGIDGIAGTVCELAQNRPNPFTDTTVIGCTVPQDVAQACILVYDLQGKQLMRLEVQGRGETSVTLDGRTLGAGMYIYSLVADGQEVATRRMILTD